MSPVSQSKLHANGELYRGAEQYRMSAVSYLCACTCVMTVKGLCALLPQQCQDMVSVKWGVIKMHCAE